MSTFTTVRLIAWREVRQRLRSRLFVGMTLGLSLILVLLAVAPAVLGLMEVRTVPDEELEPVSVAVVGHLSDVERAALTQAVRAELHEIEAADRSAAERLVEEGVVEFAVIDAGLVLEPPPDGVFVAGRDLAGAAAEALALASVLGGAGLGPGTVDAAVTVQPLPVEVVGDFDVDEQVGRLVLANLGVVLLFAVLALYATLIVNGIMEEKGSRVVELLVETVPTRQLMAGKLLGLGTVGLGQTFVLFAPPTLAMTLVGTTPLPDGGGGALLLVVLWFLLGYAFYSVVAAAFGSLVSRPEEAQAVLTPASLLMVCGYLIGFFAINAPDGSLATVAGWIPPTAPYVMLVRQLLGTPSLLEVAGAVAVTLLATAGVAAIATRIYEGGILRTGARVRLRDAWRSAQD